MSHRVYKKLPFCSCVFVSPVALSDKHPLGSVLAAAPSSIGRHVRFWVRRLLLVPRVEQQRHRSPDGLNRFSGKLSLRSRPTVLVHGAMELVLGDSLNRATRSQGFSTSNKSQRGIWRVRARASLLLAASLLSRLAALDMISSSLATPDSGNGI